MSQPDSLVRQPSEPVVAVVDALPSPAARVQASATRAATQVAGVHALGSPGGRALVRALGRVPGGRPTYGSGVSVEVGPLAVALDVSLVLEYGAQAVDVADRVRSAIDAGVAADTGLDVVEVNVTVADVHHPSDDVDPEPEPVLDPLDAEPVDLDGTDVGSDRLDKADPASWSEPATAPSVAAVPPADAVQPADAARTVMVLETGDAARSTDGPQVVQADEVVIADRVVVVGEPDATTGS